MTSRPFARPLTGPLGWALVVGVLLLAGMGGCAVAGSEDDLGDPQAAARTTFPDLPPASGDPTLPSLTTLRPAPGTVAEAPGPFDDRFHFEQLSFDGTTLSGAATITSDVSAVLEFEALAGFYNRNGTLIGTARYVYHLDGSSDDHDQEGAADQTHAFRIQVPPELKGVAVAAAVGVPVLVNE
ncbi:hypothetical protein [Microlunatus aurantiacus]|uniref:hypothetical protein n=1 Tax=Microlunatus aurantiacus TaxID=446786 RepID=UPI0031D44563